VTVSHSSTTSLRRCDTYTTQTPRAASPRITPNSFWHSSADNDALGSSIAISLASLIRARPMLTNHPSATLRRSTGKSSGR